MYSAYDRVRKHRQLKRPAEEIILSSNASDAKQCRLDNSNSCVRKPIEINRIISTNNNHSHENNSYDHNRDNSSRSYDDHIQLHNNLNNNYFDNSGDDNLSSFTDKSFDLNNRSPDFSSLNSESPPSSPSSQQSRISEENLP